MNDIQDDIIEYGKMLKKYHRKQERQFKRALLKAWMNGKYGKWDEHFLSIPRNWKLFKPFLLWYNKQNFEL